MSKEHTFILNRMSTLVKQTTDTTRAVSERYMSLCNKRLRKLIDDGSSDGVFGIVGASLAIEQGWKSKFGYFKTRERAILL